MRNASISFGFAAVTLALALQTRSEAASPIRRYRRMSTSPACWARTATHSLPSIRLPNRLEVQYVAAI